MLRERRFAWQVANAFDVELPKRESVLRNRMRAERDFLAAHLREHRTAIPARVIDDFEVAIDALSMATNRLDAAARGGAKRSRAVNQR